MPRRHLNFRQIESRLSQLVIDLHDAARLCQDTDIGIAYSLRQIAADLNDLVQRMRRLLPSDVDSRWGEFD